MKVVVIVLILIIAGISKCGFNLYKAYDEFPEAAQIENLQARYATLMTDLDKAIEESDSFFSLAATLENIEYPEDTLSVSVHGDADDEQTIINNFAPRNTGAANSSSKVTVNNGGYGHKNGQHFWILQHPLDRYEYEHIEILFVREKPE